MDDERSGVGVRDLRPMTSGYGKHRNNAHILQSVDSAKQNSGSGGIRLDGSAKHPMGRGGFTNDVPFQPVPEGRKIKRYEENRLLAEELVLILKTDPALDPTIRFGKDFAIDI